MPVYSIVDTTTNEIFEVNMKFTELENYLKENPHLKQVFCKFPAIGDPIRLGTRKPPEGFRDVLRNIGHHHKKNQINTW